MRVLRPILLAVVLLATLPAAASAIVPPGFQESTAYTGLVNPTAVEFAADGRVFVGEKRGRMLTYDSLADPTPTVFADLSASVHDFWDRGLLGMALDPDFTTGSRSSTSSTRTTRIRRATSSRAGPTTARRRRAPPVTAASSPAGSRG